MKKVILAIIIAVYCLSACKPLPSEEQLSKNSASDAEKPFSIADIDRSLYDSVEDKEIVYALTKTGENAPQNALTKTE